jgi:hypothetical protein
MVGTKLVTAGINQMATDLYAAGAGKWKYIHWGIGTTDPVIANTALENVTGCGETRATATITNPSSAVYRAVGSLTCNATGKTISEAGLFETVTVGILLIRGTFTGIPVVQNDVIEFTFNLTYTTS